MSRSARSTAPSQEDGSSPAGVRSSPAKSTRSAITATTATTESTRRLASKYKANFSASLDEEQQHAREAACERVWLTLDAYDPPFLILSEWAEGGLRVQATDSARVWEQRLSQSELIECAAEHDAALWQAQLKAALAGTSPQGFDLTVRSRPKSIELVIKACPRPDVKIELVTLVLGPAGVSPAGLFERIAQQLLHVQRIETRLKDRLRQLSSLSAQMELLDEQFTQAKRRHDEALMTDFVDLLNARKRRIRRLQGESAQPSQHNQSQFQLHLSSDDDDDIALPSAGTATAAASANTSTMYSLPTQGPPNPIDASPAAPLPVTAAHRPAASEFVVAATAARGAQPAPHARDAPAPAPAPAPAAALAAAETPAPSPAIPPMRRPPLRRAVDVQSSDLDL